MVSLAIVRRLRGATMEKRRNGYTMLLNRYELSDDGAARLMELRESGVAGTLPADYRSTLERDPVKASARLRAMGFHPSRRAA